jgi:hypothetical protein
MDAQCVLGDLSGRAMGQDGPYDDGNIDDRPERHVRGGRPDAEPAGPQTELAEPRTRTEYYEAMRAADGEAARADEDQADERAGRSGWEAADIETRPLLDSLRVTPERTTHILDGDETGSGGGHRHGVGKPGKTEFPASWDDAKIISTALNVAGGPDRPPVRQDWNDTWLCTGTRDGVDVSVVVMRSGEILTSWPEEGGPGVVRNPKKGHHD